MSAPQGLEIREKLLRKYEKNATTDSSLEPEFHNSFVILIKFIEGKLKLNIMKSKHILSMYF